MRFSHSRSQSILTFGLLCTPVLVTAFPLIIRSPFPQPVKAQIETQQEVKRAPQPQGYSVVAVDGGSSSTTAPTATKTVTDAVTSIQTSIVMSTVTVTPTASSGPGATILVPATVTLIETLAAAQPPSVTSLPYDDGQWHTTYYFRSTVSPAAAQVDVAAATALTPPTPTSTFDPGQWAPWADKMGSDIP